MMHFALRHTAFILIILYLSIPVMGFAHAGAALSELTDIRSSDVLDASPCDHCPCSDRQGSRCCDTTFCSCAFHTPPVKGVQVRYLPVVIISRHTESFRPPAQVYFSIFVPPQNRFLGLFI